MGYTTEFDGRFELDKPLTEAQRLYLVKFQDTRRMKRDEEQTALRPDPIREAVGLPVGVEGGYFVGAGGDYGQEWSAPGLLNSNDPPNGQPGLWCKWVPTEEGTAIEWSGAEKFYDYVEWLEYLIKHFLEPWGYTVNGSVRFRGEDFDDIGTITVNDNHVSVHHGSF